LHSIDQDSQVVDAFGSRDPADDDRDARYISLAFDMQARLGITRPDR
jgi:hypothetical protein